MSAELPRPAPEIALPHRYDLLRHLRGRHERRPFSGLLLFGLLLIAAAFSGCSDTEIDPNELLNSEPPGAGGQIHATLDPYSLPLIAVEPGEIAPWQNSYYANALASGEWLEFEGDDWGTPVTLKDNRRFNPAGYPKWLRPGKMLRSPLTGFDAQYPQSSQGQVVLEWKGHADIRLPGSSRYVAKQSSGPATGTLLDGRRVYRFIDDAVLTNLVVHEISSQSSITDIKVWLPDPAEPESASLEGQLWHPSFLEHLREENWGFVRTTTLATTRGNPQINWEDRRLPSHVFASNVLSTRSPGLGAVDADGQRFPGHQATGVPYEHLVALANETDLDLWISVPHLADKGFIKQLAQLLRFGSNGVTPYESVQAEPEWAPLEPGRRVFVEYSAHVWTDGEPQAAWLQMLANKAGLSRAELIAGRTAWIWRLMGRYLNDDANGNNTLVRVASVPTGDALELDEYLRALVQQANRYPDVVSVTSNLGSGIQTWVEQTARLRASTTDPWFYVDGANRSLPIDDLYWSSRAFARHLGEAFDEWQDRLASGENESSQGQLDTWVVDAINAAVGGVPIIASGGTEIQTDAIDTLDEGDEGITYFMAAMIRHERIADIYRNYLGSLFQMGLMTYVPHTLSGHISALGFWGHLEYVGQAVDTAPKYAALRDYIADYNSESTAGEEVAGDTSTSDSDVLEPTSPELSTSDDFAAVVDIPEPVTERLRDWAQPSHWQNCNLVGTVGEASIVDNRLRVTVSSPGQRGPRMFQRIDGLEPGKKYHVTGERYRGSQKSVGIQISQLDCYNGAVVRDYGFNDNTMIDLDFTAEGSTAFFTIYGGYGDAGSHVDFAGLSLVEKALEHSVEDNLTTETSTSEISPDATTTNDTAAVDHDPQTADGSTTSAPKPVSTTKPSTAAELLHPWYQASNWHACDKVSTVGETSMVDGRLRVTVAAQGSRGPRMFQRIDGLEPGKTYRVTGKRFRGSQKSVGLHVSTKDCFNGVIAKDYGFNDNTAVDISFQAEISTAFFTLYAGYGDEGSHVAFADLSLKELDDTGGSTTTQEEAPTPIVADSAGSNDNVKVPYSVMPSFTTATIDTAMKKPLLLFAPRGEYGAGYPYGSVAPAVHYLSLVAYISPETKGSDGALIVDRIVQHLTNVVKSGNEAQIAGQHTSWHDHHLGAIIALAKLTPSVWSKLTSTTQQRLDWAMRIGTYTGNIQHNAVNACYKDIGMRVKGGYNPNQATTMGAWMSYAYIYFGGADAVNKVLDEFNYDQMMTMASKFGWSSITETYGKAETKMLMTKGGISSDGACQVNPMGARKPFTFNGRASTGDLSAPNWTERPGEVPYEPFALLKRMEHEWNINAEVVDEQAGTSSCGKGHIKPGYKSPHLGKIGMFLEYNLGRRSSPDYVAWGAKTSVFHLTTLLATGYWGEGGEYDAVYDRYKIAMDVMRYRETEQRWYDTVKCKYHSGFGSFLGGEFVDDLYDSFVESGISWQHAPVMATP